MNKSVRTWSRRSRKLCEIAAIIGISGLIAGLWGVSAGSAQAGTLDVIHSFDKPLDGTAPLTTVIVASDGRYYGTTSSGGRYGHGVIYRLSPGGAYTVLHNFNGTDGSEPAPGGLFEGRDHYLYGVTFSGGPNSFGGVVFKISQGGAGFKVVYSFAPGQDGSYPEGSQPEGGVYQAADGKLYGTASQGGKYGAGVLFSVNTDGSAFADIHDFANGPDGANPFTAPIGDTKQRLYGTTSDQSTQGKGTIYLYNIDKHLFHTIHNFTTEEGTGPGSGRLAVGGDGALYGACFHGGKYGYGTIWSIAQTRSFAKLYDFAGGSDEDSPNVTCVIGRDGSLFGTTTGESTLYGTIYSIHTDGTGFRTLYSFNTAPEDPLYPNGGNLTLAADGSLLGATVGGGDFGNGAVYRYSP